MKKVLICGNQFTDKEFGDLVVSSRKIDALLQNGCKYNLQPGTIVSQLSNCWKTADTLSVLLKSRPVHRSYGFYGKIFSPDQILERIIESGHDLIIVVVHFDRKEDFKNLLAQLGADEPILSLFSLEEMDIKKDLFLFVKENSGKLSGQVVSVN